MFGYTENGIAHHGRPDGDAELLQKPFLRADLARAVRKVQCVRYSAAPQLN